MVVTACRSFLFALATALFAALGARAEPDTLYAAFLTDPDTGEVLHARHADDLRHPASLTKLMTLYLAFEDIQAGEIGFGDRLRVSAHAAAQPPTELGLREGDSIRVLEALKAVIVRSANDAAVVLAERLEGDEETFARRMTRTARALGMSRTRYVNASGLPDPDQVTTARDVARLAAALRRDFPEYYALFEVRRVTWNGATYYTHNAFLDLFDGADGLKTGYIRASGYNLAASAARGDQRLIAVVLGGSSARERDAHAALLMERGFEALAARRDAPALIAVADHGETDTPRRRLQIILDTDEASVENAAYGREPSPSIAAAPLDPIEPGDEPEGRPEPADAGWRVQVGAFNDSARAHARLADLRGVAAGGGPLPIQIVTPVAGVNPPMWRARLGGFPDRAAADAACARLKAAGGACFVINAGER